MSKENNNFRLLGSPVNLSYRNKKKEGKNIKGRPRSALQNASTVENLDKLRRPYSADAKERAPSTRSLLKTFSAELLQSYSNSPLTVKVLPPTEELLNNYNNSKDIGSNASDYGSEDTFISLGTKIKAKAQTSSKNKPLNSKHFLRYRNIAKRGRKVEGSGEARKKDDSYDLDIRITQKPIRSTSPLHNNFSDYRTSSPTFKSRNKQMNFMSRDDHFSDSLSNLNTFDFNATGIENFTHSITKQHLSLVEEESSQDLESIPSQRILKGKNCNDEIQNIKKPNLINLNNNNAIKEANENNKSNELDTYNFFYENIHGPYKSTLSSTYVPTDTSSKDSGYPDSITKDEKRFTQSVSLPNETFSKKLTQSNEFIQSNNYNSLEKLHDVDSIPVVDKDYVEPMNHSRLLYKDFFLKKEGHLAVPPNNTPTKNIESALESSNTTKELGPETINSQYPPYLVNSSTKAYTSKVIEEYKKEIEAINNLHELTLKDIKTDSISPTPLNLDVMFEQCSNTFCDEIANDGSDNLHELSNSIDTVSEKDNNFLDKNRQNASKIKSREIIQNYFKVKNDCKDIESLPKNLQKYDKKLNNITSKYLDNLNNSHYVNNKSFKNSEKGNTLKNQRSTFTIKTPMSARFESVENDKDVESWMSMSAPSPLISDIDQKEPFEATVKKDEIFNKGNNAIEKEGSPTDFGSSNDKELTAKSTVLDIYTMLKEIESFGERPITVAVEDQTPESASENNEIRCTTPKDSFMEIFEFLEKVEQSANDALSVVTNTTPQSIPKLEMLLKLPQTELAQRLVTSCLQLEERSCCIALLQESLTNHKQQMINKVNNLEKQSQRNVARVKQECEEAIRRHQSFIDQLINDKKTLNHRIEQLVDERRSMEERWKRSAQSLEERYKLELRNQHDKMAAAQQVARQRWVKQKAEKIKELTVKGLEGELREMADRQQKEISDLKMSHAEQTGRLGAKHSAELEELRRSLEEEKEEALVKERQLASARMEKQILELELTYQEQRTRLVSEMRAENERVARELAEKEKAEREDVSKWKEEQEKIMEEKRKKLEEEMAQERERFEEQLKQKREELHEEFEKYKRDYEAEQHVTLKRKVAEMSAQHKMERDREIEKAIESMEAEAQVGRREMQDALRRNKEQYEAELRELGETEKATLKRYQDAQARIRQTEDRCAELELQVGQLELRNKVLNEKNSQLECRAEEVRANCEECWKDKLDALRREMEDARKTHEEHMHQLYAKVKVAVARKDSAIQALTREAGKYQEKITLLEQKLQQQRKDFLKSK